MPILQIKALPQEDPSRIRMAIKKTAIAISKSYGCLPENVWVAWQEIKADFYVEGEIGAQKQPRDTHPPICELICFEGKSSDEIEIILSTAAQTLSSELDIHDNIFITYREAKSGQVIAGNGILKKNNG